MKVVVGSKNPDKIKIVKDALEELHLDVEVVGVPADSGIANQPLDKKTTKRGAINRAKNAKKVMPEADLWLGLEGGLHDYGEGYHLVTFACIVDKSGERYLGEGVEIHLPESISDEVRKGGKFGDAIRIYAREYEIDQNLISRETPFKEAVQNAYVEYLRGTGQLGYRRKTAGVIIDKESNYLIVQLTDYSEDHWNFSGGGIEEGESEEQTILRELKEELGTDKFEIINKSRSAISYDWPAHVVTNWFIKRGKSHRGQEVRYFLVKFIGEKEDIKPDPEEIRYVKWVEYKELESHFVILNQWKTAKKIIKEFSL
ncbi:hypothetical protein A2803_02170 [Candidatus Woesebacteria bacterium RIFCSPHIGHO2_01_FULL_44_21]|uniref:inosine/xanthosine triphosphatase n=1 Tax=Candidatus Woesebacteria bacterium RIFCSPHIGHO2_01_FULL_44_21 TaxID=1802503 RepID=A0A1F7YX68_9BACT|nr:MAG: hypothetical protein A2803_02170 [Candidatus Woesebacteria bacterium RIFCSPHIGHO2_01_FULL_44_21]